LEYVSSQAQVGVDLQERIEKLRPLIDLRSPLALGFAQSHSDASTDTTSGVETPDIDVLVQKARSRLYDKIQFDCGKMQLLNRQVPIDNLYTDVYILEDIPHQHFVDISERVQDFDPSADDFERFYLGKVCYERVPGLEVVKDRCKLMCLGAPGSGKTTYLYYVATQCNEGKLQPNQVPVFIRLLRFADNLRNQPRLSLLDYLDTLLGTEDARQPLETEALLRQGRVLILLDGLNEVPQADNKSILNCIREFCETYHKNSIIITCRSNALDYSFRNLGFTEVMVADFNFEQIEIFANKWFVAVAKNNLEAGLVRSKQFLEKLELPENKRIRDLAVTPILLNLTCLVFEDMRGNFPSNRAKLYQRGLDILLKKWDEERGIQRDEVYESLSLAVRKALLNQVATVTFEKNRYFFEQEEIEAHIADFLRSLSQSKIDKLQQYSAVVLKSIEVQHGLLVERAQKVFSFSHLTFQEYFTAKNFVDSSDPAELDYTVVSLKDLPSFGSPLILKSKQVRRDDRVAIIQHPGGHLKKISMQNNFVAYADANVVQYTTSTLPGSSGSPVFDDDFQVIAIHHSGGMLLEPGTKQRYLRNAGTSMIAVLNDLKSNAPEIYTRWKG
jgi:predicted NACHT family NTPase